MLENNAKVYRYRYRGISLSLNLIKSCTKYIYIL